MAHPLTCSETQAEMMRRRSAVQEESGATLCTCSQPVRSRCASLLHEARAVMSLIPKHPASSRCCSSVRVESGEMSRRRYWAQRSI